MPVRPLAITDDELSTCVGCGLCSEAGIVAVIPPKSNRRFPAEFDRDTYKWRHLIENFFQKIKEYRGIATRFCKTDTSYSAFISLAATVIRLK